MKYGLPDVLQLTDVETPVPLDDEVLVEVHAASVNALDWHMLTADVFLIRLMGKGLIKPSKTTLGADISGRVVAVGKEVRRFQPGDPVFGTAKSGSGGFAEYVCAREETLQLKPSSISFEEAAAVPLAALKALQGLRDKGQIAPGKKVLIHGASGGVGTFAVQIARSFGAEVTAVCSSRNLEIARSIGADHVIDYTLDDFTRSGELYDLIFVANGDRSIHEYKRSLKPEGICVLAGGGNISMVSLLAGVLLQLWVSKIEGRKIGSFMAHINQEDLTCVKELLESGKIKPVIDRRCPLSETAEALRYLGDGHAKGKVVITVRHESEADHSGDDSRHQ